jgi:hypothetical protein
MASDRKDQRINPFRMGLVGLLLLLVACFALSFLNSPDSELTIQSRMQRAVRSGEGRTDPTTAETLARVERYYRSRMYWKLLAQTVFFLGVGVVVAAGVLWYQQAQQPEPIAEPEEDDVSPTSQTWESDEPTSAKWG